MGSNILDNLLNRLESVTKTSKGIMAKCPAHNDTIPSLSIKVANDDRILLNCFAGCKYENILKAIDLTPRDLVPHKDYNKGSKKLNIHKEYDYTDKDGKLLHQAVRFEGKSFSQRRPDGNGGWIWNLKGVKRTLYRLPEVIKNLNKMTIIIVEGEKENVARLLEFVKKGPEHSQIRHVEVTEKKWSGDFKEFKILRF